MSSACRIAVALLLAAACSTPADRVTPPGPPRTGPVAGVAAGFDGRPTAGITVRGVDVAGALVAETVTADDGHFVLQGPRPIAALVARCEAVRQDVTLPADAGAQIAIRFAGCAHFTVQGRLVDPGGSPGAGIDVALRDAHHKVLAIVTTAADGGFAVRANEPVQDVLVDPLGWAHAVAGPITADATLDLDLRRHRSAFMRLRGRTLDSTGAVAAGVRVVALTDARAVARTTSGTDGAFTLWTTQPVARLAGFDGALTLSRGGPWRGDAEVDLDERQHGTLVVRGHIADPRGARTAIYAASVRPKPPHQRTPDGVAGKRGEFAVRVPRDATHLWFFQEGGNHEAWVPIVPGQDLVVRFER